MESKWSTGIKLLSRTMREIEYGSESRWKKRGGRAHAWDVFFKIAQRYHLPEELLSDIVTGNLRAYH